MFNGMTTVTQGAVGLGTAISYFVKSGICVSVPLVDNQNYDLVVDIEGLKKVQVKTSRCKKKSGNYEVCLRSVRPNRTQVRIDKFDSSLVDYVFVLTEDNSQYLIPSDYITQQSSITLSESWNKYKV